MIQRIYCTGCGADGALPVCLAYKYHVEMCDSCHHRRGDKFEFRFCGLACVFNWMRGRDESLPCLSCAGSGNAFQFVENGPCRICGGAGKLVQHSTS